MKSSFIAYVDESGDQGFVFHSDGGGSSRWFILSAAVIRQTKDQQSGTTAPLARLWAEEGPRAN